MKLASISALMLLALLTLRARANDTVYYYYNDAQGSPVAVADASGNVVETTEYSPYGQTLNRPVHDGPGYTGHEEDSATGLSYMQQRYYDPQSGQFISTDPVLPDGDTGASFNRYAYANDNPYRYLDPDGRENCSTGTHLSGLSCESLGVKATKVGTPSVTAIRAFNVGHKAYIQYADGATEVRSGSRPWRDNNPGDLRKGSAKAASSKLALGWDYSSTGPNDKITTKLPFAIFSSAGVGDRALEDTLTSVYGSDTVGQAIKRFAPSSDANNPQQYSAFIMAHTGASASATINSLTPAELSGAIDAIKAKEGFNSGGSSEIYNFGLGPFSQ